MGLRNDKLPEYTLRQDDNERQKRLFQRNIILTVVVCVIILLFYLFMPQDSIGMALDEKGVFTLSHISGNVLTKSADVSYSFSLDDTKIVGICDASEGELLDGVTTKKCSAGLWKTEDLGQIRKYVYNSTSSHSILMEVAGDGYVVFNLNTDANTTEYMRSLSSLIENRGQK